MRVGLVTACLVMTSSLSSAEEIAVAITNPQPGTAVFGELDFSVEVSANERIQSVDFWVDGEYVTTVKKPPYRTRVDVGNENISHQFTAVARAVSGSEGTAHVSTPEVVVDLEMDLWLQQLYVTVTRDDEAVLDLERNDFSVEDNGVKQELVTFERGEVPMTIVLLIDVSGSMKGERFAASLRAARGLLARLDPLDEVLVMISSDRVLGITDFHSGTTALPSELEDIKPGGGTSLNDHLYAALELLDDRQGRPVVILLSDGVDTLSLLRMEDVLWKIHRSNALIYRIHLTGEAAGGVALASVWRDLTDSLVERRDLEYAIEESGGRIRTLARTETLEEALESILQELRQQYVLGYYPTGQRQDGSWRHLEVTVSAPELTARTRAGYIDHR